MTTEQVKISQVKTNAENPRTITKPKFQKLIDSILAFPAMLDIRPVVVDSRMAALGGNMRLNALKEIAKMSVEQLAERLYRLPEYQQASEGERGKLVEHWSAWLEKPVVPIINARHLTEQERRQFVIKDNVSYGAWDYDALANKWDSAKLEAWGMDVWNFNPSEIAVPSPAPNAGSTRNNPRADTPPAKDEDDSHISPDDFGDSFTLPVGDRKHMQQLSFHLADEQASLINESVRSVSTSEMADNEKFGNENSRGNALYKIVKEWAGLKK